MAQLRIMLGSDGAIGVSGPVDDPAWCLRALKAAEDAMISHRTHLGLDSLSLPAALDVREPFRALTETSERTVLAEVRVTLRADGGLETQGPIDDSAWMLAMIRRGIDALQSHRVTGPGRTLVVAAADAQAPTYRPGVDRPGYAPREPRGGSMLLGGVSGVSVEYGRGDEP